MKSLIILVVVSCASAQCTLTGVTQTQGTAGFSITFTGMSGAGCPASGSSIAPVTIDPTTGDIHTPGALYVGEGSGQAGAIDLIQGTAPSSFAANAASIYAPSSVPTSYQWRLPGSDGTGCLNSNGAATPGLIGITTCGVGGGGGSVTFTPPYVSPDGGTTNYGPVWSLAVPPTTGWTGDNMAGSTFDASAGYPYLHVKSFNSNQLGGEYRTAPSTPYSLVMTILDDAFGGSAGTGSGTGLTTVGWRDSAGKIVDFRFGVASGVCTEAVGHWNSTTAFVANVQLTQATSLCDSAFRPKAIKLSDDGTNLSFTYSIDGGRHWLPVIYSEARSSFLTAGPSQIFYGLAPQSTSAGESALIGYQVQ